MSSDRKQPAFDMKQRLTGALVLVALAVIIVPLVLDFRQDYDRGITSTNIPPEPDDFRVEVFNFDKSTDINVPDLPVDDIVQTPASQTPSPARADADDTDGAQTEVRSRVTELRNRRSDSKDGNAATAGQPRAEAWVVQLASLTREANAQALQERVRKKGLHAFIVRGQVNGKTMYRVLVGPELLRSNAEKQRQRLRDEINLNGLVIKYQR
jgi:DedD protein